MRTLFTFSCEQSLTLMMLYMQAISHNVNYSVLSNLLKQPVSVLLCTCLCGEYQRRISVVVRQVRVDLLYIGE